MRTARLAALTTLLFLAACGQKASVEPVASGAAKTAEDVAQIRGLLERIQTSFNSGDLDAFMPVFADDALMMAPGAPTAVGRDAIRAVYDGALAQVDMQVAFNTEEIEVSGDLGFERGTYTIHVMDKTDHKHLAEIKNRHIHVFKRQADGSWKTWRMMTNGIDAAAPAPSR
jgi:uncharacterized protein (TIGR02246 family)